MPPIAGCKDDSGKEPWHLLPWGATELVVQVLQHGAEKYSAENWRLVQGWRSRYFAALMRHVWAWMRGERLDADSQLPHLAHAACCVLFMLELSEGIKSWAEADVDSNGLAK